MSHRVGTVTGEVQLYAGAGLYARVPTEIHVGSFAGGVEKGRCCQITIRNEDGYAQLTAEGVESLIGLLRDWQASHYRDGED